MKQAIVLVSGGLDSATTLAIAKQQGYQCHAISFDYGQRHISELQAAKRVAEAAGVVSHRTIHLDLNNIGGSALTEASIDVPVEPTNGIPVTYVPARNTVFLSLALGLAEVVNARDLFIGVTAVDYSGYPDCRPEFIEAFEKLANVATKAGVEGDKFKIHAPLIDMSKEEIIQAGIVLGVDYGQTISCYQADSEGRACGVCESCYFRKEGFKAAGVDDPTRYQKQSS